MGFSETRSDAAAAWFHLFEGVLTLGIDMSELTGMRRCRTAYEGARPPSSSFSSTISAPMMSIKILL